jgi:hypothetical protein
VVQKTCGQEAETGEVCGVYLLENDRALAAFRETELADGPFGVRRVDVRREAYEVLYPLCLEHGPVAIDPAVGVAQVTVC